MIRIPFPNRVLWILAAFISLPMSVNADPVCDDYRIWKDATGKYEVEAKFVRAEASDVVLEKRDGNRITIPLEKLSAVDQGFVQGLLAARKEENPFREMKESGSPDETGDSTTDDDLKVVRVNFDQCPETAIVTGHWNPVIAEQPELPFDLQPIAFSGKRDFFEGVKKTIVNVTAERAVITHHVQRPGTPVTSRLTLLDLKNGSVLSDAVGDGQWIAIAIHDDGERIVVQNMAKDEETQGQLGTVRLTGDRIEPLDLWIPYESMNEKGKEKVVTLAEFINNHRLLTLSQNGNAVIWDFEARKPLRRFRYHGACQPSLTYDRKYLAICGGELVGMVNLDDETEKPSVKSAPQMNYWLKSAFSPSCKRFAATTMSKLMIWDVATGDVLFEGSIPGLTTTGQLLFPHEDFVMINGDKLIEYSSSIKVWRYHGAPCMDVGGRTAFVPTASDGGKFLPLQVPHEDAKIWLARAKEQSDLFVLKKGAEVALDVSGVPSRYRGDVEQALKQQLDRMGFEYTNEADVVLKASVSGPTSEAISYHFAGSFVVKRFSSRLNFEYQGKSIWSSGATNVPGAVSGGSRQEIQKELTKAGRSPNIGFFGSTRLPEFLQKPQAGGGSGDSQMLGRSRITVNGFQE